MNVAALALLACYCCCAAGATGTTTPSPTLSPTSLWNEDEAVLPGQVELGALRNLSPLYVRGLTACTAGGAPCAADAKTSKWARADFAGLTDGKTCAYDDVTQWHACPDLPKDSKNAALPPGQYRGSKLAEGGTTGDCGEVSCRSIGFDFGYPPPAVSAARFFSFAEGKAITTAGKLRYHHARLA